MNDREIHRQLPQERIALSVQEDLDVGCMRVRRHEMNRDLRLLMVRHLDVHQSSHVRNSIPLRDAAAQRAVHVQDVDTGLGHQIPASLSGNLALPGRDRDVGLVLQHAQSVGLVVPYHRLFHPADPEIRPFQANAEADGVLR